MGNFSTFVQTHRDELDLYTKAITRAHGTRHPEVFEVRAIYDDLVGQLKEGDAHTLSSLIDDLVNVTQHFTIPDDVCPTFVATYTLLQEAVSIYQGEDKI